MGHSHTSVTPIVDAYTINHAVNNSQFGSCFLDELLMNELPFKFQTSFDQQWRLRQLKERIMSFDFTKQKSIYTLEFQKEFKLPDGKVIQEKSPFWQRSLIATLFDYEACFRPAECHQQNPTGLQTQIADSLHRSDVDLRSMLKRNLVIAGGNSLGNGFDQVLLNQLNEKQVEPF